MPSYWDHDVAHLPFADGQFDSVLSSGAIALFNPALQQTAIAEMGRVARLTARLLESFEKRKGFYWGRLLHLCWTGCTPSRPHFPPASHPPPCQRTSITYSRTCGNGCRLRRATSSNTSHNNTI